jgi:excinuclease ABC subunit A
VVAEGTPEAIVKAGKGHTARFLKEVLERRPIKGAKGVTREAAE